MKINSLTIRNYRGVRDVHLTPGNAMLMLGLNGQGKSTILQAVNVLLFGGALDARGNRILVADLIGPHGNEAEIAAVIETPAGTVRAEARITAKGVKAQFLDTKGVGLYSPNAEAARIAFWAACGLDAERAAVACNPRAFLMAGMGGVLAKLEAGGLDAGILRDACGEHWEFVERLANTHRTGLSCIQQLDELGKVAYSERTATNKVLKDAEKRAALAKEKADGVEYNEKTMDAAYRTMRELEQQVADLHVALGRAQSQAEEAVPDYDALATEKATLEKQLQNELAALLLELPALRERSKAAEDAHKKAAELVKGKESALNASARLVGIAEGQIKVLQDRLIVAEKGECPTCGAKQKKADFDAVKRDLSKAEIDIQKTHNAHQKAEEALANARTNAESLREAYVSATTATSKSAAREAVLDAFLKGEDPHDACDTMKRLGEIAGVLNAPRVERIPPAEIEQKIAATQARIDSGRASIALGEAAREAETHANEVEAYRAEVAELDWVVKAFKEGVVTKQFAGDGLETFVQEASERLAEFGYGLSVRVEGKTTDIIVIRPDGVKVPYQWASKGERVLCEWAVSCIAPAAVTCLDDLDALSGTFKQVVIPQIASRTEGTTLAASTWGMPMPDEDDPKVNKLQKLMGSMTAAMGLPVVWIEEGAADAQERAA